MALTVRQRAETLATFRFVEVHLMETLARWVPTTPEMEAKTLFGRHIWDTAQHADALGRRTCELRAPLHYTLRPRADYVAVLTSLAAEARTPERIHGFYEVVLAGLEARYQRYLERTDALLDGPSVCVVDGILRGIGRMRRESRELREELEALRLADEGWALRLFEADTAQEEIVREPPAGEAPEAP